MDNKIHVKLEYEEAVEAKKDILSSEMNLLRIAKEMARYKALRRQELELKIKFSKKIKEARAGISKLHRTLPKLEIPDILKEKSDIEVSEEVEKKIKKSREKVERDDIEFELQEIQNKLNALRA